MKQGYSTDLTDSEWLVIYKYFPRTKKQGRPVEHLKRTIVDAILYILRAGCAWELLPNNFPPFKTVYHYFRAWKNNGFWKKIHDTLRQRTIIMAGRKAEPSAGILDSQSVKTTTILTHAEIDQFFVKDILGGKKEASIVKAIISMAHSMGMKVVAEGIETREQMELLFRMKCDYGQGYLFSPALPQEEFTAILTEGTRFEIPAC